MLSDINELAESYILKETSKITVEQRKHGHVVYLFKIIECIGFTLDDLNLFISFRLTHCNEEVVSKLSRNHRFIVTYCYVKGRSDGCVSGIFEYRLNDQKVVLEFCKIRTCTKEYAIVLEDYLYEYMTNIINVEPQN